MQSQLQKGPRTGEAVIKQPPQRIASLSLIFSFARSEDSLKFLAMLRILFFLYMTVRMIKLPIASMTSSVALTIMLSKTSNSAKLFTCTVAVGCALA